MHQRNNQINSLTGQKLVASTQVLIADISNLIEEARLEVSRGYSVVQIKLCWLIGKRIDEEILQFKKAQYGEQIMSNIAEDLTFKYGRGYSQSNLFKMLKLSKLFSDLNIFSTLSRKLCWSHFVLICSIEDSLKRDFYIEMCSKGNWSVRRLQKEIDSMVYERTLISRKPSDVIEQEILQLQKHEQMTPAMIFKDPYFLDFYWTKAQLL